MAVNLRCLQVTPLSRLLIKKAVIYTPQRGASTVSYYHKMSGEPSLSPVNGLKLQHVVQILEKFASTRLAEDWDNVGLLVEPATSTLVKNIMLTNDLTEKVMEEAIEKNINLIISYHPPIFKPLKKINKETWKGEIIALCLENRIAVYSPHTAWDAVYGGVSDWLADAFKQHLETEEDYKTHALIPNTDEEKLDLDPNSGMGRIVYVNEITTKHCVDLIKSHTGLSNVRIAFGTNKTMDTIVKVIAVVPGSGGSLLKDTYACLFVTGEMSHHDILEANHTGATVILTNHSDSERGFLKEMRNKLDTLLEGNATIIVSERDHDPLVTV